MDIFKIVNEKSCSVSLTAKNKEDCLKKLADLASRSINIPKETILESLEEREKMVSTGLENGVAIPHSRLKEVDNSTLGIAVSKKGIDFKSLDGKKSNIFFILIGPEENTEDHLKIMAQIMRVAKNRNAYKEMLNATSPSLLKEAFLRNVRGTEIESGETKKGKDKLFIISLYEQRYFEDIINVFLERGIKGAAVFDIRGMRNILSGIPLFSDFMDFLRERSDVGQTIMALVNEDEIPPLVSEIEEILGDLDTHTGAMVCAVDIFFSKGTLEVL